jgi:hypothetical protein
MFLEILFAFGLGLLLAACDAGRTAMVAAVFIALSVMADAIILTFTRGGLATIVMSATLVGFVRYSRRGVDVGVRWLVALSVLILVLFTTSRSGQAVWLRLTSEGQYTWYRSAVQAPAALTLQAGSVGTIPVRLTNLGRLTWDSTAEPPFYLSYHWLQADGARVVTFDGARTAFAAPVAPGAILSVDAVVRAPRQPGRYRLEWDVVQEGRLWFNTEPGAADVTSSQVTVDGVAPANDVLGKTSPVPSRAVRPGRLLLWRAAARMFAAHPILGVGPDNFRLRYGQFAGLLAADERVHSNNMFIEMIVGGGLIGGLAFLWLTWRSAGCCVAAVARSTHPQLTCALGVAAAGTAVCVHGMLDSFLSFTPTYVLIALTLGLAAACAGDAGMVTDADRI